MSITNNINAKNKNTNSLEDYKTEQIPLEVDLVRNLLLDMMIEFIK